MIVNTFAVILAKRMIKMTKVSQDTGISRTTLTSLYYKRTQFLSLDVLDKLCTYLECDIADIFEFQKEGETDE